jgi:hypothetical protein
VLLLSGCAHGRTAGDPAIVYARAAQHGDLGGERLQEVVVLKISTLP